jgi:hypothetical protein
MTLKTEYIGYLYMDHGKVIVSKAKASEFKTWFSGGKYDTYN